MATTLKTGLLRPYKSLLLATLGPGTIKTLTNDAIETISSLVSDGESRDVAATTAWTEAGTALFAIHYVDRRPAPWTSQAGIQDITNHLVLWARRGRLVAIFCSDNTVRDQITRRIDRGEPKLALTLIRPGRLNKAFVSGRTARTVWLSGTHRRSSVKADSKVLTGIDLRDALDPLDDQSYHFSSIRCETTLVKAPVGVSPRNSRVWAGRSEDWTDFRETVEKVLQQLQGVQDEDAAPLPVLATPAAGTPDEAFDVALLPDDGFGTDPGIGAVTQAQVEMLVDRTEFEVISTTGGSFGTRVYLADYYVGDLSFAIDASDPDDVKVDVNGKASGAESENYFRWVRRHARRRSWLKVRYESGHTISDGQLYSMRHRDVEFQYTWGQFDGFTRKQEKPADLDDIGETTSLFCWVQKYWPSIAAQPYPGRGWLACDDGSMEIADFIHVDTTNGKERITLIHVKGAKTDSPGRGVSVSPYEVVTGQAVKNLRHLDRIFLSEGLAAGVGKKISKHVWNDGQPATRDDMIAAMQLMPASCARDVVIIQPQLSKKAWAEARANPKGPDAARLRQLDTLLVAAAGACRNVNASLIVVADDGPPAPPAPATLPQSST